LSHRFDADTTVWRTGDGAIETRIDPGWWVMTGPNGGYVAALLLRGLALAQGDPERTPRSLTIHYTSPPQVGPASIETRVERMGRSLTTLSGRLLQDGKLCALALAAFSTEREGPEFVNARMPEVLPPERCAPLEKRIEIHDRYEQRWAIGAPPFSGSEHALSGGWIRFREPRALDALSVAAFADAFPPAVFSRMRDVTLTGGVPTIDLTLHFRSPLPASDARPDAWVLAVFQSRVARGGFVEEDGEIWTRDGMLIAQSRQLALLR
jgi:acyl-CoA thioesterase